MNKVGIKKEEINKVIEEVTFIKDLYVTTIKDLPKKQQELVKKIVFRALERLVIMIQNKYAVSYEKYCYLQNRKKDINNWITNVKKIVDSLDEIFDK